MTRSDEEHIIKNKTTQEHEYIEITDAQKQRASIDTDDHSDSYDDRHDADTISVNSVDEYSSQAASIFLGGSEDLTAINRKRKTLRNYEDNVSQNEYDC